MSQQTLVGALQALKSEKASLDKRAAQIDRAIAEIEALVRGKASKAPGPAAKKAKARRAGRTRKNAPKGLLKKLMHEALKGQKKPLAPVALRNAIIKAGYPVKNPQTLYTALFNAAKKDSAIKKTKEGFSLK